MGRDPVSQSVPEPDAGRGGAFGGERRYDSFVVRLWREAGSYRLLRVDVEHTQSDGVVSARGVAFDWIGARISELIEERSASGGNLEGR